MISRETSVERLLNRNSEGTARRGVPWNISGEEDEIMSAWAKVAAQVSDDIGRSMSLLRIDSIVWQSGQIIGNNGPDQKAAGDTLIERLRRSGFLMARQRT